MSRPTNEAQSDKQSIEKTTQRLTPAELDARLRFIVGLTLAITMVGIIAAVLFSLIFVTQPIDSQAPNDAEFFKLVTPIATFLTGALSGIMVTSGGSKREGE
jgi:hypothetical protein